MIQIAGLEIPGTEAVMTIRKRHLKFDRREYRGFKLPASHGNRLLLKCGVQASFL